MNMSTNLDETVLFVEAKYEHMLLCTFQIVGYFVHNIICVLFTWYLFT